MRNKRLVLTAAICLLIQACGGAESDIKQAVREQLKDPDSAKFGELSIIDERLACLTFNSKNGMGGYAGDEQAILKQVAGKWVYVSSIDATHDSCVSSWPQIERELRADDLLKAACAEQKDMGEAYSKPSEGMCRYGNAMSDEQKLAFVDSWNAVKDSLSHLKSIEAEGREKGYIN